MTTRSKSLSTLLAFICIAIVAGLYPPAHVHADSIAGAETGLQKTAADTNAKAHTPPAGSAERKEVMDGRRGDHKVVFKVHYLKVHDDWAFIDVTPLDAKGKPVAEGGASLMHKENGAWKVMDLSVLPDDPDNPMGIDDPTPKFVRAVQKAFPGVPSDIFPPRRKN